MCVTFRISITLHYDSLCIERNSMRLDGSSRGIVTKTVHKTPPGGVLGVSGVWGSPAFLGGPGV